MVGGKGRGRGRGNASRKFARLKQPHVSPSQWDTFHNGCRRKWAFDKIDKIPRKAHASAVIGTKFHAQNEMWLRDATSPDVTKLEGRMAMASLKHLPAPKTVDVERKFRFSVGGVHYLGIVDVFDREFEYEASTTGTTTALVLDHKSTGDFAWAKTPEKLATDSQRVIYAAWAVLIENAASVLAKWVYTLRNRPHPTRVHEFYEEAPHIIERFHDVIHPGSVEIIEARKHPSDAQPKNFSHCSAYGGCPYIERCHAGESPAKKLRAIMSQNALLAKLKKSGGPPTGLDPAKAKEAYDKKEREGTNGSGGNALLSKLRSQATDESKSTAHAPEAPETTAAEGGNEETPKAAKPKKPPKRPKPKKKEDATTEFSAETKTIADAVTTTVNIPSSFSPAFLSTEAHPSWVRALFHAAAIASRQDIEAAEKHFQVWKGE